MEKRAKVFNWLLKRLFYFQSFGRDKEYVYEKQGAAFYCRRRTSDRFVVDEIWNHAYPVEIHPGDVVVDLGGNIGAFAVYAARQATAGRVFTFEPDPTNFFQLQRNITRNQLTNVTLFPDAVAGRRERRTLFLSKRNKGSSSLYAAESAQTREINCIPLQDVFTHCGIERIDVLKIDVEGAEYEILLSAPPEVFARIARITLEFHDFLGLPHRASDLVAFLEDKGYQVNHCSSRFYRFILKQGVITARRLDKTETGSRLP